MIVLHIKQDGTPSGDNNFFPQMGVFYSMRTYRIGSETSLYIDGRRHLAFKYQCMG